MGPRLVQHLDGSDEAKERLEAILESLTGTLPIPEACASLGIGEAMFHRLRMRVLQVAMADLESRPRGRRRRAPSELERQCDALTAEIADLKSQLLVATVRGEVHEILRPSAPTKEARDEALKKTKHRRRRRKPR